MHSIYKYPLKVCGGQEITLPVGAKILSVQMQNETPCIWALVNTDARIPKVEQKLIRMIGTGHNIQDPFILEYIGTIQTDGGQFVWHVFIEN